MTRKISIPIVATVAAALVGCGSSGSSSSSSSTALKIPKQKVKVANYHPNINPADFHTPVTNPYLPFIPGTTHQYKGTRDGVPTSTSVKVTNGSKTILGVKTVVVSDIVTQSHSLVEKTTDWYAQDKAGNVWYFGEDTAEYANGTVTSTAGTWEAGVDNAQPGIVMKANPTPGPAYREEYRPGQAEDMAKVLTNTATITIPKGTFHNLVETFNTDPLDPSKLEHKWYAKGIGPVKAIRHSGGHNEISELVK